MYNELMSYWLDVSFNTTQILLEGDLQDKIDQVS